MEAWADFALLTLPLLALSVLQAKANVQNVAQAIKTSIFFERGLKNKNIEAQACVSAEFRSVGGVIIRCG